MQSFDFVALLYDFINRFRYQQDTDAVLRWLSPVPGKCFLDIGGGTGAMAHSIFQRTGCRMVVVDPSAGMMAIGKTKGHQAEWLQASPDKSFPLTDKSVDGSIMVYTLHHIRRQNQLKALKEISRVLKKGSKIVFVEMDRHNLLSTLLNIIEKLRTVNHVWFIGSSELRKSLGIVGLTVEHYEQRRQGYILCAAKS